QPNEYSIPFNIDVRDGGVDAWVKTELSNDFPKSHGLIKSGYNVYQIKTGSFSASKKSDFKKLFFEKGKLHDGVKRCFDNKGTFIVFLFGDINPDVDGIDPRIEIREELSKINEEYSSVDIIIWKSDQIAQLLSHFPNISLAIMNRVAQIYPIDHVKKNCGLDGEEYYESEENKIVINSLKEKINIKLELTHIRYIGEPGIGKTRTIYEALSKSLHQLETVYCESAEHIIDNDPFIQSMIEHAENHPIILIVDECDSDHRSELHRKFRNAKMTLISIYNEFSDTDRNPEYIYLEPPKLTDEKISQILQSYDISKIDAEHIKQYCSGSPRVAHIVGKNLRNDPSLTQLTKVNDSINNIWEIYISDRNTTQEEKKRRKLILSHLALFRKFGWVALLKKEADLIYNLIVAHVEPTLSYDDFQDVITICIKRKILQGGSTLYITPKLLHIKLWSDWCDKYSHRYDPKKLIETLAGSQLKIWFSDMIRYVGESKSSGKYFENLLAEDGIFQNISDFNDGDNGALFTRLVQVNPEAAVRAISRALGKCSHADLVNFKNGRRTLVNSLEKIALYGERFEEAADLLLDLSLAENESWSNNATGVFKGLFSVIATGNAASTSISPQERLPILLKYINSENKETRLLAIDAFDEALRAFSVIRTVIRERATLSSSDPEGWIPKNHDEFVEEYDLYLKSFWEIYKKSDDEEKKSISNAFLHHVRVLLQLKHFQKFTIDMLSSLANGNEELKGRVIEALVISLRYDKNGFDENFASELQSLHDQLSEVDLHSMLKRYVGLNLLEDRRGEQDNNDFLNEKLNYLAGQIISAPIILDSELAWMLTEEARNGFEFGKRLGLLDCDDQLWLKINKHWISLRNKASDFFFGGFLSGVFERDVQSWESKIYDLSESVLSAQLPYLVLRSGMSPKIAKLLLDKSRLGLFEPSIFKIYVYGAVLIKFPEDILTEIFMLILKCSDRRSISSAIEMLDSLLYNKHMLQIIENNIFIDVLTHKSLFSSLDESKFGSMGSYTWSSLALALAKKNRDKSLIVLEKCLKHLDEDNTIVGIRSEDVWKFLDYCGQNYPNETWHVIAKNLDPFQSNAIAIFGWLNGGVFFERNQMCQIDGKLKSKTFSFLPKSEIFKWIDENLKIRAPLIARFAPFELSRFDEMPKAFMRELLEKYGSDSSVLNEASANYNTEGWSGSISAHYVNKLKHLEEYISVEKNRNIKKWLEKEISTLKSLIEEARIREERD
ncbi:MAG: hypothetical protein CO120_09235, partial [Gammaproteobacteria bacterium CG_4_9_14_3_um_filter_38_9]